MRKLKRHSVLGLAIAGLALAACGIVNGGEDASIVFDSGLSKDGGLSGDAGDAGDAGERTFTLTIQGFHFIPANLVVPPGSIVTVVNRDSVQHSVTSTSRVGQFTPGGVNGISFDTGPFTGSRTLFIPANATSGTVIPYYCSVHTFLMNNRGQITIREP